MQPAAIRRSLFFAARILLKRVTNRSTWKSISVIFWSSHSRKLLRFSSTEAMPSGPIWRPRSNFGGALALCRNRKDVCVGEFYGMCGLPRTHPAVAKHPIGPRFSTLRAASSMESATFVFLSGCDSFGLPFARVRVPEVFRTAHPPRPRQSVHKGSQKKHPSCSSPK
jgi:hypothetical protein